MLAKITEVRVLPVAPYSAGQFIDLALIAARLRQWQINHIYELGFVATTGFTGSSLGEDVNFTIEGENARVECSFLNEGDRGKAREHLDHFVHALNEAVGTKNTPLHEDDKMQEEKLTIAEKIQSFFTLFKPQPGYLATPIIINLNVLIYLLMLFSGVDAFSPSGEALVNWGANYRPITLEGEAWRLFTACFLHVGLLHLLLNMFALVYIGGVLEGLLGTVRFSFAYLLTGLTGSLLSLYWHHNTVSAGASGAIFGLYGVFLALLTTHLVEKSARADLLTSTLSFVGYNLFFGMKGNIDNAGHIGGLAGGLLVGYCMYPGFKQAATTRLNYCILGALTIGLSILTASVVYNLPNEMAVFQKKMNELSSLESKALELYNLPSGTDDEVVKNKINEGIVLWSSCVAITKEIDHLALPDVLKTRNRIIGDYCRLRIRTYNLIFRSIVEKTEEYETEIENCNKQIQAAIDTLSADSVP